MAKDKGFIKLHKKALVVGIIAVLVLVIPPVIVATFILNYYLKIYPQTIIDNMSVSGMTQADALSFISSQQRLPTSLTVVIQGSGGTKTTTFSTDNIQAELNFTDSIRLAYEQGRSGNVLTDIQHVVESWSRPYKVETHLNYNEDLFSKLLDSLTEGIGNPPEAPRFALKNGDISILNGVAGDELPKEYAQDMILTALRSGKDKVVLNTRIKNQELTEAEREMARARAQKLIEKSLTITVDNKQSASLKIDKILPFLNPQGGYNQDALQNFINDFASENDREVSEPVFKFEGSRVQEFAPGTSGVKTDVKEFYQKLSIALSTLEESGEKSLTVEAPHQSVSPSTQVADVNNLGIKELIGEGTSRFAGSIPSRVYNVALASSRINGVLVPPGETFSFAQAIGDVSKYTGYKEAYIIQNGRTILGDGGGVCQVSTTLFRAVMSAGLPIVERHAHAYRVGYYEQDSGPGLDATVYVPSVDFKFQNDTGNYILVTTSVDTKKLTADFKIYGTSDGRIARTTKPVVTNQITPEEDLYIDDPSLPTGKVNQVEHKAWGARVSFSYTVTRDGQEIYNKNFVSVYQPWRAVYMRGVGPS